jgi:hypothetical protein
MPSATATGPCGWARRSKSPPEAPSGPLGWDQRLCRTAARKRSVELDAESSLLPGAGEPHPGLLRRAIVAATTYQDYWINPRLRITALWTSMMFIYAYVDLFSLYRADVRADIEAGKIFAFTIGQGFLLGVTIYILVPSVMLFLTLVLPVRLTRTLNIVLALLYALTIVGGTIGEANYYYILGSVVEAALLAGVVYYAWSWPKVADSLTAPADQPLAGTRVSP